MSCCGDNRGLLTTDIPQLGQVTTGSTIPSGTGKFYLVNPVLPTGLDGSGQVPAEGGLIGYSVDSSRTLLFHVIGDADPQIGEILIGHYVSNGIWVAERMHVSAGPPPITTSCSGTPSCVHSVGIPQTLNFTIADSGGSCGYASLNYDPGFSGFVGPPTLPITDTFTYVAKTSLPAWCPQSTDGNGTWIGSVDRQGYDSSHNLKTGRYILICQGVAGWGFVCQDTSTIGNLPNFIGSVLALTALGSSISSCSPFFCQRITSNCSYTLTE